MSPSCWHRSNLFFSTLTWKSVVNIWLARDVGSSKLSKSSPNSTGEAFIVLITSSAHIFLDSNILYISPVPLCIGSVILLFGYSVFSYFSIYIFSVCVCPSTVPFSALSISSFFLSFAKRTVCVSDWEREIKEEKGRPTSPLVQFSINPTWSVE